MEESCARFCGGELFGGPDFALFWVCFIIIWACGGKKFEILLIYRNIVLDVFQVIFRAKLSTLVCFVLEYTQLVNIRNSKHVILHKFLLIACITCI